MVLASLSVSHKLEYHQGFKKSDFEDFRIRELYHTDQMYHLRLLRAEG